MKHDHWLKFTRVTYCVPNTTMNTEFKILNDDDESRKTKRFSWLIIYLIFCNCAAPRRGERRTLYMAHICQPLRAIAQQRASRDLTTCHSVKPPRRSTGRDFVDAVRRCKLITACPMLKALVLLNSLKVHPFQAKVESQG